MNQWSRQKFVPKRNRQVLGLKQQAGIRSRTKGTGRYKDQRPKEQAGIRTKGTGRSQDQRNSPGRYKDQRNRQV